MTLKREYDVQLIDGDGIAHLEKLVTLKQESSVICLFHSYVANQFSKEQKIKLLSKVSKVGRTRDIVHTYNNMWDLNLHLNSYINGHEKQTVVGSVDGHGKWFTWNL